MKKILNIFKNKKNTQNNFSLEIDKVLEDFNLDYSDIDFKTKNPDVLKSYNSLNTKIHRSPYYLKNIKSLIPFINYKAFLKPAYTIILTSIVIFTIIELNKTKNPVEFAAISVDAGEKITLHISDEITVWLNSESKIKIPLEIKRNSKIYLDGEAYFEINQKNKSKKTNIISGGMSFECKNGSFYINSQQKNNELIASVKEGSLNIYNPVFTKSTKLTLKKGDKATYNRIAEFISIEKNNNINYLAWKTRILKFEETSLTEVSQIISNYYNIPVTIKNTNLKYKTFTASFKNADIDEILDNLQLTFNCEISGDGSKIVIN